MERKDSVKKRVFVIGSIFFVFMLGLHFLDLGQVFSTDGSDGCNGFWCVSGIVLYHWFGMYTMVASFIVMTFLYTKEVLDGCFN